MYIKTHPQNTIMNEIATYLGPKGYTILKKYLDKNTGFVLIEFVIKILKNFLTHTCW